MVLGPLSSSDDSYNLWYGNNQGVTGAVVSSEDGGATWTVADSDSTLSAFAITSNESVPEPASWPVLLALTGAGVWWRLPKRSAA
jgi:hypothetical protein